MANNEIKNFGILGNPLEHSLSPLMHVAAFKAAGMKNYNYTLLPTQAGRLMLAVDGLKGLEFRGANVTIPHKTAIIKYLDALDTDARVIGAVNTIVNDGGMLTGYNTDVTGFLKALVKAEFMPEDSRAVILGAGGAARAVLWGLCKRKAGYIMIGARRGEQAKALAEDFKSEVEVDGVDWTSEEFKENLQTADILINTTPLGMYPKVDEMPPIDLKLLPEGALVYDIIYNPAKTKLLKTAEELGYPTLNGLTMFLFQGEETFRLFTDQLPDLDVMEKVVKQELENFDE